MLRKIDVYFLESEWVRFWIKSGKPKFKNPDGAFIAFCRTRNKLSKGSIHIDKQQRAFNVYPNPTTKTVTIEARNNAIILNIEVFDINGKLIKSQIGQNNNLINFETAKIVSGIYYVKVETTVGVSGVSFIKI